MPIDPVEQPVKAQTPPAAEQDAPKVTFDDAQKARINEIVKEASARAGAEARAELARVKATLPVAEPQSADTLLRLAEAEAELSSLRSTAQESQVSAVLHKAVASQAFYDSDLAAQILRASIRVVDGKPVVIDATGAPRLNSEFNPMTPAEAARELAESKKFLVRSDFKPGVGSVMSTNPPSNSVKLEDLFGSTSNGALANRMAMSNPAEYRRKRAQAVQAGLLRG